MSHLIRLRACTVSWRERRRFGPRAPRGLKEIRAVRIRLQPAGRTRNLALFDLAIDGKLRDCDLARIRCRGIAHCRRVAARATVAQRKTGKPARIEITGRARDAIEVDDAPGMARQTGI